MTPYALRRTFASILAVCDVPPRRAMDLLGHTDPKFTRAEARAILNGESSAPGFPERIRNGA